MIIDRVINPEPFSRRALASEFPDSGLSRILKADKSPSLDIWYQSLESLVDHQMEIQKKLYRGCSNRIFLYDITSTYFEGKCCPLAYLIVWESPNRLRNLLERDTETRECEGDSLREIWKALNKIKLGIIDCDGRKVTEISALTTRQKRILKALNAQIMTKERIRIGLRRHKKRI